MLPTPNEYRTGSGAPGPKYWQQQADYNINVDINDDTHVLTGSETIVYVNNSPDVLKYLWLQLDKNILSEGNMTDKTKTNSVRDSVGVGLAATTPIESGSLEVRATVTIEVEIVIL